MLGASNVYVFALAASLTLGSLNWCSAQTDAAPTLGLAYNQTETHFLRYECARRGDELECSFVQVAVRRQIEEPQISAKLESARKDFAAVVKDLKPEECQKMDAALSSARSGLPPPGSNPAEFQKFLLSSEKAKSDMLATLGDYVTFCRQRSIESYIAFVKGTLNQQARTCVISANPYVQRFRRVENSTVWAVMDKPTGPCGAVNLSRFEAETASGFTLWNYVAKKAVTNKRGEVFPGASCSGLDEREYLYSWRSRETQMSCDYVSFSPI